MSTFAGSLKIIPRAAWIVGIVLSVSFTLIIALGPMQFESEVSSWPAIAKAGLLVAPLVCTITYSLLVGFIYADAKRRRMRHVMWAWLALVPYFIGVILYFILRDPLPTPCGRCGMEMSRDFAFCPGCGSPIHPKCAQCGKAIEPSWANCPHCGAAVSPSSAMAT